MAQQSNAMTPEQLATLVSQTVAATLRGMSNTPDAQPNGGSNPVSIKPDDVGYFNPGTRDPEEHGIVSSGKTTVYTDVFAFTHRLQHLALSRGEQPVKDVWGLCLQGTALHWHSFELTDLERTALSEGDIKRITTSLESRFKKTKSDALKALSTHTFTLYDLFIGKNMRAFVQRVIADAKACDLPPDAQLLWAFESFDSEIQGQLIKPKADTTLGQFLDRVDEQESVLTHRANERFHNRFGPRPARQTAFFSRPLPGNEWQQRPDWHYRTSQSQRPGFLNQQNQSHAAQTPSDPAQLDKLRPEIARTSRPQDQRWQNTYDNANVRGMYPTRQNFNAYRGGTYGRGNQRNGRSRPHWKNGYTGQPAYFSNTPSTDDADFVQSDFGNDAGNDNNQSDDIRLDTAPIDDDGYAPGPAEAYDVPPAFEEPHEDVVQFGSVVTASHEFICHCCQDKFTSNNQLHRHIRRNHQRPPRPCELDNEVSEDALYADIDDSADTAVSQHADPRMSISGILAGQPEKPAPAPPEPARAYQPRIIKSSVDARPDIGTGYGFRSWTYLKMFITPSLTTMTEHDVCADTGCSRTLGDIDWIQEQYPDLQVRRRATPLVVRGIGSSTHTSYDYVIMWMYFKGVDKHDKPVMASWRREVTLVQHLPAHILLGMDIIGPEKMDICTSQEVAIVNSCEGIKIPITMKHRGKQHRDIRVQAAQLTSIPPHATSSIPVNHHAPHDGQDLLFEPSPHNKFSCFAALANADMSFALVRNDTNKHITVPRNATVGVLSSWDNDAHAYQVAEPGAEELAVRPPYKPGTQDQPGRRVIPEGSSAITSYTDSKIKHPTGVQIYDDPADPTAAIKFTQLITRYADVFTDQGFVNVDENEWMRIQLRPGWERDIPKKCRPYDQGPQERAIIRETVQGLVDKQRAFRTKHPVPFSFPVFVAWRTMPDGKRKGRMVVDIRVGNRMALPDAYPMKTQDEMMAKMSNAAYITVMDAVSFYYQWRIHPDCWWAFTITTPEGQYTFTCLMMGYRGSNAYVQRQMDRLLAHIPAADSYCDDLVVGSPALQDHLDDLESVFRVLRERNISMGPAKTFVGFPNAIVLGRMVDAFGMSTTEERLKAIAAIKFPANLKDLETFLGMAGYMRHNVPMYAIIAEPLEKRKTALVAHTRDTHGDKKRSKPVRQRLVTKMLYEQPSPEELASFDAIKDALTKHTTLHFFVATRPLAVDFDVSGRGIGVCVYHITDNHVTKISDSSGNLTTYPARTAMQPIAFLSRTLSDAERKYWATEMEIVGFVWALRKTKHWIDACSAGVYVFTDHRAIIGLHRQTTDIVNSTAMSVRNKRLIRALEYISQFSLTVMHKPGNLHVIPDALSRLPRIDLTTAPDAPGELDILPDDSEQHWRDPPHVAADIDTPREWAIAMMTEPVSGITLPPIHDAPAEPPATELQCDPTVSTPTTTLIHITPTFKEAMQRGYLEDPAWNKVLNVIKANDKLPPDNRATLPFQIRNGLLWKTSDENPDKLCVPRSCLHDIFETFHGRNHIGYERLSPYLLHYCILNGRRELRRYLKGCPECAAFRTRHHQKFGSLQPIIGPPCPYHTITIDFIIGLPTAYDGSDAILSSTCKMSKEMAVIPGHTIWTSNQWANALIDRLLIANWGIPKVIISDRDPKFLAALWASIWTRLGTRLLYSTAYKPSTDGQSERTNQMIESALRYYINGLIEPARWPETLPRLQFEYNNSMTTTTKQTPNEIVRGFTPNGISDIISESTHNLNDRPVGRVEAHDALCVAAMSMKEQYDRRHLPQFFNVGDRVLLRLHKGYAIPSSATIGRKLGQQYAGPFLITQRVGRSAYRLQFPSTWKIHNVISLDHLEPIAFDAFGRYLPYAGPIRAENHARHIRDTQTTRAGHTRWLVSYDGLGPEFDEWRTTRQLGDDADQLIAEYQATSQTGKASAKT